MIPNQTFKIGVPTPDNRNVVVNDECSDLPISGLPMAALVCRDFSALTGIRVMLIFNKPQTGTDAQGWVWVRGIKEPLIVTPIP